MNITEQKACEWLKSNGAKEIKYQHNDSPDFITDIGLFEVKTTRNGEVVFTKKQVLFLKERSDIRYLIYVEASTIPLLLSSAEVKNQFNVICQELNKAYGPCNTRKFIIDHLLTVYSASEKGGWGFETTSDFYQKYNEQYPKGVRACITLRAFVDQLHGLEKINVIESRMLSAGKRGVLVWRLKIR